MYVGHTQLRAYFGALKPIRIEDGLIATWHEYLQRGPASYENFLSTEGKQWQWHIGNYP